ncbi:MAG: GNAT family N-acetyltransferase [Chloroflexota bacterium]|jgi:GNAT superfamily N-acetyltransferase
MTNSLHFRRARPEEAPLLAEMTMQGLYHWGYEEKFPGLMEEFRQENLPTASYIEQSPVYCLVEGGRLTGYYGLVVNEEDQFVDLRYFFLDTAVIGRGYGRRLWLDVLARARELGFDRLRIVSDPAAVGFYQAMGASLEREHVVQPGFALGIMWYDLGPGEA